MITQVIKLEDKGRVYIGEGIHARYQVEETGISATPMSLTIKCHTRDQEGNERPLNDLSYDSTLYFDREGKVVDRAPMRAWTTTRKMQDRYADKLLSRMNGVVNRPEMSSIIEGISGFFEGEEGIKRRIEFKGKKSVVQSWL